MSSVRRPHGKLFQIRGPAAPKLLSPKLLFVLGTAHMLSKAYIALPGNPVSELQDVIWYGITQCYLLPDTSERVPPNPSHAGWYSIYLPRRDGRLVDLIMPRPGVEPATFRSRVRRRTAAPPRQSSSHMKLEKADRNTVHWREICLMGF